MCIRDRPSPLPSVGVALTLEITSMGTESARACAIAVIVLVRPGPVMTKATPGRPDARAYLSLIHISEPTRPY